MLLLDFIIRICHDAPSSEGQIREIVFLIQACLTEIVFELLLEVATASGVLVAGIQTPTTTT